MTDSITGTIMSHHLPSDISIHQTPSTIPNAHCGTVEINLHHGEHLSIGAHYDGCVIDNPVNHSAPILTGPHGIGNPDPSLNIRWDGHLF